MQGDERFGDIRLFAAPLSFEALALALPFGVTAGTTNGDVTLNSAKTFGPGGEFDLFTVMLHEAGHVFGVAPSDDQLSAMFQEYQGPRAGLSPADVQALRDIYGSLGYFQWTGFTKRNPNPDKKVVDLTLTMDEDKRYYV